MYVQYTISWPFARNIEEMRQPVSVRVSSSFLLYIISRSHSTATLVPTMWCINWTSLLASARASRLYSKSQIQSFHVKSHYTLVFSHRRPPPRRGAKSRVFFLFFTPYTSSPYSVQVAFRRFFFFHSNSNSNSLFFHSRLALWHFQQPVFLHLSTLFMCNWPSVVFLIRKIFFFLPNLTVLEFLIY